MYNIIRKILNMNISQDIEKFYALGNEQLQKELQEQIELLRKKSYLFKVLDISLKMDEKIKSGFFEKVGFCYIELKKSFDYDFGEAVEISIIDRNNQFVSKYWENSIKEYKFIDDLLGLPDFVLEENLFNKEFNGKTIVIPLNSDFKEKIKEICLNEELLILANYVNLNQTIDTNNQTKQIRRKI